MAKKKKATTNQPRRTDLKAVEGGGETPTVPEPQDYVERALDYVKTALQAYETAMHHLNDPNAGKFLLAIKPDEHRKKLLKAIGEYGRKTGFALTSLRDEIMIALQMKLETDAAANAPLPEFVIPVPTVPVDVAVKTDPKAVEKPTLKELEEILKNYELALLMLAECEIAAMHYEKAGKALTFIKNVRDSVRTELEAAKSAA